MRLKRLILAAALMSTPVLAHAHALTKGPNGGQVVHVQGHHVEFTVKDNMIVLFFTAADDKPEFTKGAVGRAIIQDGGKQVTVDLVPTDPNLMVAKLDAALKAGAKVVVSCKLADGHEVQSRFVAK